MIKRRAEDLMRHEIPRPAKTLTSSGSVPYVCSAKVNKIPKIADTCSILIMESVA